MGYYKLKLKDQRSKSKKKKILKTPVLQIDLLKSNSVSDLLSQFKNASIQARNLGECASVFEAMLKDKERPTIILGLAGPLIAAGLRKVIRDMIEYNLVDAIVSTGAIMYQDYYQALGHNHYKGTPDADDSALRDLYIDRIYDTYVDEEKFAEVDSHIAKFACNLPPKRYSSREFLSLLSETVKDDQSILVTARKRGIPIFCPALNDSSIGIGLTEHYYWQKKTGNAGIILDAIRDNYELTQIVVKSKKTAAFYVAGGVPKNFINDSVVMSYIFGNYSQGHKYALQVTADSPHWGGLSGSTLKEATSWGKINKTATRAMAFIEPSVSFPLIVKYALEKKLGNKRKRLVYKWDGDELIHLRLNAAVMK
ncbi:deoxyhypusine synthase family protein [Candidatus Saganbacteria bacterium]|nr:deoxyhypusine synthase family protein [Candidatus Saganbacteria bacterium]